MMFLRKFLLIVLLLCLACFLTAACSNKDADIEGDGRGDIGDSVAGDMSVDLDLTLMSGTMVYSVVSDMMEKPESYLGQKIKASGTYYASYYEQTDLHYHYLIIESAVGCCPQGLEFVWSGERVFPDDYHAEGSNIELTGMFGSYEELGSTWYYLAVDDIVANPS